MSSTEAQAEAIKFSYVVIAEENARRIAVVDATELCRGDSGVCDLVPVRSIELAERPHNLTAIGAIVYATHPASGTVSRIDVATGDVLTVSVGTEPHDIKPADEVGFLIVADEKGRKLLRIDAETLAVAQTIEMPGEPHDMVVDGGTLWVTLIGRSELVKVVGGDVELFTTGGSPHDLVVARDGKIWFSNWGSDRLGIFDPDSGIVPDALVGVGEPQHFAVDPVGSVWISDIAAGAVVGFVGERPTVVQVGASPHHVAFIGNTLVVAVSGTGEAVFVEGGQVVARARLSEGLHGVAIVELAGPLDG